MAKVTIQHKEVQIVTTKTEKTAIIEADKEEFSILICGLENLVFQEEANIERKWKLLNILRSKSKELI